MYKSNKISFFNKVISLLFISMLTMSFLQAQVNDWEENIITPPGGGLTNDSGFGDFDNDGDEDIIRITNSGTVSATSSQHVRVTVTVAYASVFGLSPV